MARARSRSRSRSRSSDSGSSEPEEEEKRVTLAQIFMGDSQHRSHIRSHPLIPWDGRKPAHDTYLTVHAMVDSSVYRFNTPITEKKRQRAERNHQMFGREDWDDFGFMGYNFRDPFFERNMSYLYVPTAVDGLQMPLLFETIMKKGSIYQFSTTQPTFWYMLGSSDKISEKFPPPEDAIRTIGVGELNTHYAKYPDFRPDNYQERGLSSQPGLSTGEWRRQTSSFFRRTPATAHPAPAHPRGGKSRRKVIQIRRRSKKPITCKRK